MRKMLASLGTLAAAGLLTVGLTTSANAAVGTLYMTQNGQMVPYTNPGYRTCFPSDPAGGDVTFYNKTNQQAYLTNSQCSAPIGADYYLRSGQTRTVPAGTAVWFPS
ncbi:hypothetical protein HZZ00_18290 [Streptomyces sp. NEAU-sy36]|uniref:hypothetical protein n=2 Tax=unclassified Streptomyces TaxID=2593676 RepID=UPI0015D61F49|nr:hypothetical protein [Streptomyces sp. NEAU-sy36]QLJ02775.1 hypothetical protein HZZ00_18290 [Streptomyces sp. NEAU-sy36]